MRNRVRLISALLLLSAVGLGPAAASIADATPSTASRQAQGKTPRRTYKITAYGSGLDISISARSSREVQVRVTDQDDKPMPDVPVVFALSKAVGTLTAGPTATTAVTDPPGKQDAKAPATGAAEAPLTNVRVVTGPDGVATASFTAGAKSASGSISATVAGTNAVVTGNVRISPAASSPGAEGQKGDAGKVNTAGKKGGGLGIGDALTIALLGTAGAALAGGAALLASQSPQRQEDCGPSPGAEVNSACFGSGRNAAACEAAIAKMTRFCQCNGFRTFNRFTGGCE